MTSDVNNSQSAPPSGTFGRVGEAARTALSTATVASTALTLTMASIMGAATGAMGWLAGRDREAGVIQLAMDKMIHSPATLAAPGSVDDKVQAVMAVAKQLGAQSTFHTTMTMAAVGFVGTAVIFGSLAIKAKWVAGKQRTNVSPTTLAPTDAQEATLPPEFKTHLADKLESRRAAATERQEPSPPPSRKY